MFVRGVGGSNPSCGILPNLRDFSPNLCNSSILNKYLKNANRAFEICWIMRLAESSTNENNTGEKTGDVERSPGLALVLDTELNS